MPTYKGNAGHLMQHWTLCELLVAARKHTEGGLNYIDAHAMAPLATEKQDKDVHFDNVKNCSPSCGESNYELAWHQLTSGHPASCEGYPNSAAFVEQVWKGDFSMLLCEKNRATCAEIEPWLRRVDGLGSCKATELFRGDWRERFKKELPKPAGLGLANGSLTLVSFDPNMCGRGNVVSDSWWNIYPEDVQLAMRVMESLRGGILIHLPTYTANGGNRQEDVIASMNSVLESHEFALVGVVRVDGHMMSMVYARNVSWTDELANLPDRFDKWLSAFCPPRCKRHLHPDWVKLLRWRN